jgi:hypothetical protein
MSETVFILGAGASREAGAPLMADFLDVADELRKGGQLGDASSDFDLVFKGLAALQLAHSKSQIDLENIESAFAGFEMGRLLGRLGNLTQEEIIQLRHSMRTVIERTLSLTIRFPHSGKRVRPPPPYEEYGRLVDDVLTARSGHRQRAKATIITFNYDIALDYAFHWFNVPVNYCLHDLRQNEGLKVLKLHGSLNWTRCSECNEIVAWHLSDFFKRRNWRTEISDAEWSLLDIAGLLNEFDHCGKSQAKEPMIVPPTWNKTQYHEQLGIVWSEAARELSDAENIFVIGYSLPESDQFFRYLYAIGTMGDARLRRFIVYNPDLAVETRFKTILGPLASGRFKFMLNNFRDAIRGIRSELGVKEQR